MLLRSVSIPVLKIVFSIPLTLIKHKRSELPDKIVKVPAEK